MRVSFSYINKAYLRDYEKAYLPAFSEEFRLNSAGSELVYETDHDRADIIVLWEGFEYKSPDYVSLLENDLLIRNHAERVYVINYDDHPEGFLAGAYTSLEQPFFKPDIHRIWPFYEMNNRRLYELSLEDVQIFKPSKLFSFRGAASHSIRKILFQIYSKPSNDYIVEHVKKWYDHADDDRMKFARLALDSAFCLCPHGYCSYTPRITEVMAMARVPVIIADDWIPFSFPETAPYYIKVPESEIQRLPEILQARRADAEAIGRNARMLWERYLSPSTRAVSLVQSLANFSKINRTKPTFDAYRERWHSRELRRQLGWTFPQRTALRVEQHVRRHFPAVKVPGVSPLMRYRNAPNLK